MKTALITGSFDPVTVGHTDIIRRAAEIFDSVIVALCHNTEKKYMFTPEQREKLLTLAVSGMKNVKVAVCRGLVADFAAEVGASVIVRGIRNPVDSAYEADMATINRGLGSHPETVFLPSKPEFLHISSSYVRDHDKIPPAARRHCPGRSSGVSQKFNSLIRAARKSSARGQFFFLFTDYTT